MDVQRDDAHVHHGDAGAQPKAVQQLDKALIEEQDIDTHRVEDAGVDGQDKDVGVQQADVEDERARAEDQHLSDEDQHANGEDQDVDIKDQLVDVGV